MLVTSSCRVEILNLKKLLDRTLKLSRSAAGWLYPVIDGEWEILSGIHYENGFSLYVGIPFCPTTCLYCSFTSYPLTSWKNRVDEYLDALEREMEASAPLMKGKILDTLYIGGGTPTTLEPAQSRRLIGMIGQYFDLSALQEFTVEAGRPDSINAEKLQVLKECGVGRISVNPQTMRDRTLKLIGRRMRSGWPEKPALTISTWTSSWGSRERTRKMSGTRSTRSRSWDRMT